MEIEEL